MAEWYLKTDNDGNEVITNGCEVFGLLEAAQLINQLQKDQTDMGDQGRDVFDLRQPAKHWLAESLRHFGEQITDGIDPSITLTYQGVILELRLMNCPGLFTRIDVVKG